MAETQKAEGHRMTESSCGGLFSHPTFSELHEEFGSGYYMFYPRQGMNGVFYLNSRGVVPYNPPLIRAASVNHDEYDILRAVESGKCYKLGIITPNTETLEKN